MVLRVLGFLLLVLAANLIIPTAMAWIGNDSALRAFLFSLFITAVIGGLLAIIPADMKRFQLRESFLMVAGGWWLFGLFGALPFSLGGIAWVGGPFISYTDAFFETVSGLTTTGASVIARPDQLPHSLQFWRNQTHWIGGMGIIVLGLAFLPLLGGRGSTLFRAEVTGPNQDKLMPRLQATAKLLWIVYVLLTVILAVCLRLAGLSWFDAICYSFSTMATGGFSNHAASIAGYANPLVEWILVIFMLIAGASFALHFRFLRGDFKIHWRDLEFRVYFGAFFVLWMGVTAALLMQGPKELESALRDAAFQVSSLLTTTGYVSADYELWNAPAHFLLLVAMVLGGCGGSTAGGIKISRWIILAKSVSSEFRKVLHPRGVFHPKLAGVPIKEEVSSKVHSFFILYFLIWGLGGAVLTMLGTDLGTALSASLVCLGNIGPGFAGVGPTDNYAFFSPLAKWLLSVLMVVGRLELFTVLVLFTRFYWKD